MKNRTTCRDNAQRCTFLPAFSSLTLTSPLRFGESKHSRTPGLARLFIAKLILAGRYGRSNNPANGVDALVLGIRVPKILGVVVDASLAEHAEW